MSVYIQPPDRPVRRCPYCHGQLNAAARPDEGPPPQPGDVSVCGYCYRVARFDRVFGALTLAALSPEEEAELDAEPEVVALRKHFQAP